MRVLIDLDEETLKWAAIQAAFEGISRKKYLASIIQQRKDAIDITEKYLKTELPKPNIQFIGEVTKTKEDGK